MERKIWVEKDSESKKKDRIGAYVNAHSSDDKPFSWELVDPPKILNNYVIQEVYLNAHSSDDKPFSFITVVRGLNICFDRGAMNKYLGNLINLQGDESCAFSH